jgi:hypothetical protein
VSEKSNILIFLCPFSIVPILLTSTTCSLFNGTDGSFSGGGMGGGGYQQGYQQQQPYQHQQPYQDPYRQPVAPPHQQQPQYGGQYGAYPQQQQQPYAPMQQYGMPQQQPGGMMQQLPQPPDASPWRAATAADGQVYYYNQITQETQWDRPAGM